MSNERGDIFSDFYEENIDLKAQVRAILVRELMNLPPPEAGMKAPFISLEGCSESEKEVIQQFIDKQGWQAYQELIAQVTLTLMQPQSCFNATNHLGIFRELKALMSGGRKKPQEPNVYDAMMMVLGCMRLIYYNSSFYVQEEAVFRQISEPDLKTAIFGILEPLIAAGKNHKIVGSVIEGLKMNGNIHATRISDDGDRVFFRNGAYSIPQRQLLPILSTDFFTTYIPIQYTPQHGGCPAFERYLQQVSGGDERIKRLIWEMIGYLLVPDMDAKAFFVLQGVGNSGKSLLGNLISSLFNPEAVSNMDIYRFRDRFASSGLKGKRLNVCMDLPRAQISREAIGTIKMITGDDTITTEEKFKAAESYKPTCKLLFGSNFPLMPADNDEAFRTRLVTIPFMYPVPPERQDKRLLDKLLEERLAIVMKALDALQDLRRRNYQFIRVTGAVDVQGYVAEHELMAEFLSTCCTFVPDGYTFTVDLMEAYNAFRATRNVPPIFDIAAFSRQLNRFCAGRIVTKRRRRDGKNLNGYEGIRLNLEV